MEGEGFITAKEYGDSIIWSNKAKVEHQLRAAILFTVALAFLAPFAVFLANIDLPEEWHGVRTAIGVFTVLEGFATIFAWLWWRGERQNESIERGFIEAGDFQGLSLHQLRQREHWYFH